MRIFSTTVLATLSMIVVLTITDFDLEPFAGTQQYEQTISQAPPAQRRRVRRRTRRRVRRRTERRNAKEFVSLPLSQNWYWRA